MSQQRVPHNTGFYPSDEALMAAIQEGHSHLLGTLFSRYADKVFGRCFQLVGNRQEADDLLQESFLRVLRYRNSFNATARFSTWLYRIATNVCLDHLKARNREESTVGTVGEATDFETPPVDRDRLLLLQESLKRLAPEKRELLVMARLHGWGYARIAAECGASEGAVRVRVHRALKELRSIVDSLERGRS